VRELGEQRMAEAGQRRLLGEVLRARRAQRAQRREARRESRRQSQRQSQRRWRAVRARKATQLASAPTPAAEDVAVELARLLERVADRVAGAGTEAERDALHAVADATRVLSPGAAEALVDWDGAEAARLRAFSVLHGVVLHVLGPEDSAWLLDQIRRPGESDAGERVA